jgi:hypothetical protein
VAGSLKAGPFRYACDDRNIGVNPHHGVMLVRKATPHTVGVAFNVSF